MESNSKEERLGRIEVQDVKEGAILNSTGVTEEAPRNPTAVVWRSGVNSNNVNSISNKTGSGSRTRVLKMNDGYAYQITPKTFYAGFHNLAWRQAVKNKSLDEALVMMKDGIDENSNANSVSDGTGSVKDDGEKEEGELEEGEIDADLDMVMRSHDSDTEAVNGVVSADVGNGGIKICELVDTVRRELENLNIDNGEKSFDKMYSCVEGAVNSLQELILESPFAEKDAFVDILLVALKKLYSVFCSLALELKVHRKETFLRLVEQITSMMPAFLSPQQLKEVENISSSIKMVADSSVNIADNGRSVGLKPDMADSHLVPEITSGLTLLSKCKEGNASVRLSSETESFPPPCASSGLIKPKNRECSLPLLDIHKDHDEDSLPSPTSRQSDPLPSKKGFFQPKSAKPVWEILKQRHDQKKSVIHPYETDALKAVSSYQQKFGHKSVSMSDKLPSPTPSEEGDAKEDDDITGEVSSYTALMAAPPVNGIHPGASVVCLPMISDDNGCRRIDSTQAPSLAIKSEKPKLSMKSRDPRLRFANMDVGAKNLNQAHSSLGSLSTSMSLGIEVSKKQNAIDDLALNGPALKRPRNDPSGLKTSLPLVTAASNFPVSSLAASLPVNGPNISPPYISQSEKIVVSNTNGTAPLHSLLRERADNPLLFKNIVKMMSPNSSDDIQTRNQKQNLNGMHGAVLAPSSGDLSSLSVPGKISGEVVPNPQEGAIAKIRMKPRDPRRILHNGGSQKLANVDHEKSNLSTSSGSAAIGNLSSSRPVDQPEKSTAPSVGLRLPDVPNQLINHLENTADAETALRPVQSAGAGVIPECGKVKNEKFSTPEASNLGASQPTDPNAWNDFERLFEGYNDQQKATIQKERARRLEEQNKMFSARKLCLVLDLDHTLLNSAKFAEVDPMHNEILRRKEEQDRDKTHRHLFRFPHIAMWTKLRPGIWNFLEKAGKLYELHLSTMGNKYYAKEMAKLLDPKGELFSGRVISRGDNGESPDGDDRVPKSKDLEGVLGMESAVVIIDDSARVWPLNKLNLIVVERYIYFPCSRRQFGLPGPSLLEIDHDERPEDGTLAAALAVIGRIHENFFSHRSLNEVDVRTILASEQQKILSGCRIVFSRVFPVGEANPHMHPLWQTAEQFGAVCANQIDDQVTHVVANSLGTDKVNWALSRGKYVVHPGWVEASALLYRRANEHDFAIK